MRRKRRRDVGNAEIGRADSPFEPSRNPARSWLVVKPVRLHRAGVGDTLRRTTYRQVAIIVLRGVRHDDEAGQHGGL